MKRVVITGMGAVTPLGNNVSEYWENLLAGVSGANLITRFDATNFKTQFACEVKNFDASAYFDRKEIRKLDRYSHFGLVAASEALEDSGLADGKVAEDRIGVIMASGIGGFETFETDTGDMNLKDEVPRPSPFFITKIIANGLAGEISIRHKLRGVNYAPVSACASSAQAIIHAFNYIRLGKAECILAGGSEAPITKASISGFNSLKALSSNNEEYRSASRPFDKTRDGFVLGEGAGALLVESLESAERRGAKIYAEIVGGGEKSDAYHITGTHPEGLGAYLAMKEAIEEAGILPSQIAHVNVHATSTPVGDPSEIFALKKIFHDRREKLILTANKSMTGHLLGAAGVAESISAIMTLSEQKIPPTVHTKETDIDIPEWMDLTLGHSVEAKVEYALSNSFGFGGHCASLVLKRF